MPVPSHRLRHALLADDSQATSNADDSTRIRVDDEDLTSNIMAEMGFSNDDNVFNKESGVHYKIVKFAAGQVYLSKRDGTAAADRVLAP